MSTTPGGPSFSWKNARGEARSPAATDPQSVLLVLEHEHLLQERASEADALVQCPAAYRSDRPGVIRLGRIQVHLLSGLTRLENPIRIEGLDDLARVVHRPMSAPDACLRSRRRSPRARESGWSMSGSPVTRRSRGDRQCVPCSRRCVMARRPRHRAVTGVGHPELTLEPPKDRESSSTRWISREASTSRVACKSQRRSDRAKCSFRAEHES